MHDFLDGLKFCTFAEIPWYVSLSSECHNDMGILFTENYEGQKYLARNNKYIADFPSIPGFEKTALSV